MSALGLREALALLTVLPSGRNGHGWQPQRAVVWYAPVGLLLGVLLALAAAAAHEVWVPALAAAVVLAAWVGLTGALHLDGLADSADALFASVARERRLEILADVHHGTFALAAVAVLLLVKFAALLQPDAERAAVLVLLAAVSGRAAFLPAARLLPSARPEGMGAAMRRGAGWPAIALAIALAAGTGLLVLGWQGLLTGLLSPLPVFAAGAWSSIRLGGLTGDVYGALIELGEVLVLLAAAALLEAGAEPFPYWGPW